MSQQFKCDIGDEITLTDNALFSLLLATTLHVVIIAAIFLISIKLDTEHIVCVCVGGGGGGGGTIFGCQFHTTALIDVIYPHTISILVYN